MTISKMIEKLNAILATEGDIRVTVYDEYTAEEGWDYEECDLWLDAVPCVEKVADTNEKVVCIH